MYVLIFNYTRPLFHRSPDQTAAYADADDEQAENRSKQAESNDGKAWPAVL